MICLDLLRARAAHAGVVSLWSRYGGAGKGGSENEGCFATESHLLVAYNSLPEAFHFEKRHNLLSINVPKPRIVHQTTRVVFVTRE